MCVRKFMGVKIIELSRFFFPFVNLYCGFFARIYGIFFFDERRYQSEEVIQDPLLSVYCVVFINDQVD